MTQKLTIILAGILIAFASWFASCSGNNDNDITESDINYQNLPSEARSFISEYFSYTVITKIELVNDDGVSVYEVYFDDDSETVFNMEGEWQQVVAPDGKEIPYGITPKTITDYLDIYYSGYGVNVIIKTGYGYFVKLVSDLALRFGPEGEYLGFDEQM